MVKMPSFVTSRLDSSMLALNTTSKVHGRILSSNLVYYYQKFDTCLGT